MASGYTPIELARKLGGELTAALGSDGAQQLSGVAGLREAGAADVSFYADVRYRQDLGQTKAGAVLVAEKLPAHSSHAWIRVANPHLAFARVAQLFHPRRVTLPEFIRKRGCMQKPRCIPPRP